MNLKYLCIAALSTVISANAAATNIDLASSGAFAVLAGSTVNNTGTTTIFGSVGLSPGSAIVGFPPAIVSGGSLFVSDTVALLAQSDLTAAYLSASGQSCAHDLSGQDLGGMTLTPDVYCFSSDAQLTGTLTLDASGSPGSVFLFQIATSLTTASGSSVAFLNDAHGDRVYWQVGTSATLGASTAFGGNILALSSITLNASASIDCGRALAREAVTLNSNAISIQSAGCSSESQGSLVPEASSYALLLLGLAAACILRRPAASEPRT